MKKLFAILLLSSVLLPSVLCAKTVAVGYYAAPGMMNGAKDGETKSGYAYEYIREMANYAGWQFRYVYGNFGELYEKLKRGEIDMLPYVTRTEAREQEVLFPKMAMGEERIFLAARQPERIADAAVADIPRAQRAPKEALCGVRHALPFMKGKRIGLIKGAFFNEVVKEHFAGTGVIFVEFGLAAEKIAAFEKGEIDYVVELSTAAVDYDMYPVHEFDTRYPFHLAVSRTKPELIKELDAAHEYTERTNPAFLHGLGRKYFLRSPNPEVTIGQLLGKHPEYGFAALALLLLVVLVAVVFTDRARTHRIETEARKKHALDETETKRLKAREQELMHAEFRASAVAYLTEHEGDVKSFLDFFADRLRKLIKCEQVIYQGPDGIDIINSAPELGDFKLDPKVCGKCPHQDYRAPVYAKGVTELEDHRKGFEGVPVAEGCPVKSSLTRIIHLDGRPSGYLAIHYLGDYHKFTDHERRTLEEFSNLLSISLSRFTAKEKNAELQRELELKQKIEEQQRKLEESLGNAERAIQRNTVLRRITKSAAWSVRFNGNREIIHTEYSKELKDVIGNDFDDNEGWIGFIHPEDRERAVAESLAALKDASGETQFDSEYRILRSDGTYHWIRSSGRVILDPAGGGEMYGICMDIDETVRRREERQRELEKALMEIREIRNRGELVIDALKSAQWCFKLSADDRIVGWEYSRDIGKIVKNAKAAESYEWTELLHPDDRESTNRAFYATLKDHTGKTPYDVTFRMIDDNGKYNWFRSVGNTFRREDGTGEFYGIHLDITERVERQQQLEQAAAQAKIDAAEETSRAKTAFLANMSHDIRTPMNAIIGFSDIAAKHVHEPEKVVEYLDKVQLAGSNLLEIINDILDMSKIDSNAVEVTEYSAYISRMPKYFHTILSTRMKEHGHTFICEAGEHRDETVWIDKPHLNRIVVNLLTNALKYTPAGGRIVFRVEQLPDGGGRGATRPTGGMVGSAPRADRARFRITVEDNGMGMSDEFQKHIFERFTREKNSTVSGIQGTGIGMAIVKSLTDAMGGTIEVKSKEGEGTKFTLTFDFRRRRPGEGEFAEEADCVEPSARTPQSSSSPAFSAQSDNHTITKSDIPAKRILLVEDNEINREIALEILRGQGFEVDTAVNGREAVEKVCNIDRLTDLPNDRLNDGGVIPQSGNESIQSVNRTIGQSVNSPYDLILMDIMMPEMNGLEAARAIRDWESRMAIDRLTDSPIDRLGVGGAIPQLVNESIQSVNQTIGKSVNSHHIPIIALSANAFSEDRDASIAAGMNEHLAKPIKVKELTEVLAKFI